MVAVNTVVSTFVSMAVSPIAAYMLGVTPTIYSSTAVTPPDGFDLYCFFDDVDSMGKILEDPSVTVVNSSAFSIYPLTYDLIAVSGGSAPNADDAYLFIEAAVPNAWTLQVVVSSDQLPVDFSDLIHQHIYFGTTDAAGASAGLFLSSVGLAYAPLVRLNGAEDLVLDGPFQPIPGTSGLFLNSVSYTFRLAADTATGTVYIFASETDLVPFIGYRLVAVLPAGLANVSTVEGTTVSVRGTSSREVSAAFDQICLGAGLLMPNIPPKADAGRDQAIRACTVGVLDGSASFDPDGGNLTYHWRLIEAPLGSSFAVECSDGFTVPMVMPSGFSDKFYSAELGTVAASDALETGDVLLVGGDAWTIVSTGVDGLGFYVQFAAAVVSDSLVNAHFKVLRQRALSKADTSHPSFLPDVDGIYRFDLVVFDGQYFSEPSVSTVNVLESQIPRGCAPDLGFVWSYLSDFWNLVDDRERIQVFWEGLAQVTASELLNLWQVDYSKSLRDVQRQFQRRWLHYDLKLAEPLPELTRARQVRAGVTSSALSSTVTGIAGKKLVIASPTHDPLTIPFNFADPYTPARILQMLQVKLRGISADYSAQLLTAVGGVFSVRITAPFQFSVDASSTLAIFTVGQLNTHPSGTSGVRLTPRVYKTDHSLLGVDIQENDVLVIGEEGYLVSRVVDDPSDDERFQRIVVQNDLPILLSNAWAVPGHVTSKLLNFYDGQVSQGDDVVFEVQRSSDNGVALVRTTAVGACGDMVARLAVQLTPLDEFLTSNDYVVYLAYVVRKTRLPVGSLVMSVPTLQQNIKETDDGAVLRNNVDYSLVKYRGASALRFMSGRAGDIGDVWEGVTPPDRLWAEVTYLDNSPTIENNFGIPAELTTEQLSEIGTDTDYLSAVRGLWYTLLNGPTMFNLRVGTQILLGLPFAEEAGVIQEIRTDFSPSQGRILVQDAANAAVVRSYAFPKSLTMEINPTTGVRYVPGDTVKQFAPMVSGAEVIDYVKDPRWFQGILNQGVFFEIEKFHKFMVRVDSAAFNLSALLFVQNFIRRVKPTYTLPLFVVHEVVGGANGDTEVSVTDEVDMTGTLYLYDGACFPNLNSATMFDQYRPAGGGVRNQFDRAVDPSAPPPTFPTPTTPITWGFDKKYLCPEDEVAISYCLSHSAGVVAFDAGFAFDASNAPSHHFTETGVTSIPAGPSGRTLPGSSTVGVSGNIAQVRIVISGTLGASPGNYELVIVKNSVDFVVVPFTVAASGFLGTIACAGALTSGNTLTARIRPASGGARTPSWSYVSITVGQAPLAFAFDSGLAAGTYCFTHVV